MVHDNFKLQLNCQDVQHLLLLPLPPPPRAFSFKCLSVSLRACWRCVNKLNSTLYRAWAQRLLHTRPDAARCCSTLLAAAVVIMFMRRTMRAMNCCENMCKISSHTLRSISNSSSSSVCWKLEQLSWGGMGWGAYRTYFAPNWLLAFVGLVYFRSIMKGLVL